MGLTTSSKTTAAKVAIEKQIISILNNMIPPEQYKNSINGTCTHPATSSTTESATVTKNYNIGNKSIPESVTRF